VLELYQAEWCPHSRKVRQRLTELGIDFIARQVAAEPENRDAMRRAVGEDEIPVLVCEDGAILSGDDAILAWLDDVNLDRGESAQHRIKALDKAGLPARSNRGAPQ
jgi:glutathione S-transferase